MEYYSALKRKKILTHATTWMNPWGHYAEWQKPITETKHQIVPLRSVIKVTKTKSRRAVARGWREGETGSCSLMGINMKRVPETDCTWRYLTTLLCGLGRFNRVQLLATQWDHSPEGSLYMGFSRWEYSSGLPCPPPEIILPQLSGWPKSSFGCFRTIALVALSCLLRDLKQFC